MTGMHRVRRLLHHVRHLLRGELGQDLLEYGMLAALIAMLCYAAVDSAGDAIRNTFESIRDQASQLPTLP